MIERNNEEALLGPSEVDYEYKKQKVYLECIILFSKKSMWKKLGSEKNKTDITLKNR